MCFIEVVDTVSKSKRISTRPVPSLMLLSQVPRFGDEFVEWLYVWHVRDKDLLPQKAQKVLFVPSVARLV